MPLQPPEPHQPGLPLSFNVKPFVICIYFLENISIMSVASRKGDTRCVWTGLESTARVGAASVPKTPSSVASSDAKAAFPVICEGVLSVPVWLEVQPAHVAGQCRRILCSWGQVGGAVFAKKKLWLLYDFLAMGPTVDSSGIP
ncbi:hypothetical protein HJG60_008152 [Phyllostomus discolor]|uniref:Uncharacterized protein n=1 Tax=Phyllostomus discolor TaxID=89673 RepID=A0A834DP73_9CHIR|nr:hypothetical protein HJG60_008152 [Phyllostomus discolor]